MSEFFINHTHKKIVPAEKDAGFNITKNLRCIISQYGWSLDDHIEFVVNSNHITHSYGVELLVNRKYELVDWLTNLRYFISTASREYRDITCDYSSSVGPFGV